MDFKCDNKNKLNNWASELKKGINLHTASIACYSPKSPKGTIRKRKGTCHIGPSVSEKSAY